LVSLRDGEDVEDRIIGTTPWLRVGEVSTAANETAGCLPPHRPERAELPHSVPQT
jgi:hypothetical protein